MEKAAGEVAAPCAAAEPGFSPALEAEAHGSLRLVLGRNRGAGHFDIADLTLRNLRDFCDRAVALGANLDKTVIAVAIDNTPIALCIEVPAHLVETVPDA